MGLPVSVATAPRTRPSVPIRLYQHLSLRPNAATSLTVHGNTSHDALAQMLLLCISHVASRCPLLGASYRDLQNQLLAIVCGCQGVENGRELLGVEFDCN
jgi:hypothetical protein